MQQINRTFKKMYGRPKALTPRCNCAEYGLTPPGPQAETVGSDKASAASSFPWRAVKYTATEEIVGPDPRRNSTTGYIGRSPAQYVHQYIRFPGPTQ